MNMNIEDMKEEFRMSFDRHDSWGHVMSAWFDIAEALHARGDDVPSHWEFHSGPSQEHEASWLHHYKSDVMSDFGEILCRWAGMLKSAGRDY
tara:strand:- start:295 stop:570 length:276 start_codon:yes stop_codon:yes gene_type:complete